MLEPAKITIESLKSIFNLYVDHKREHLLERLASSEIELDSHEIKSDKFISLFMKTEKAIQQAQAKENLEIISSLYIHGVKSRDAFKEPDTYHEVISSLGEMSRREIYFVYNLNLFCKSNIEKDFADFNKKMYAHFKETMNLDTSATQSMARRLYRTGFISPKDTIGEGIAPRISKEYSSVLDIIHQNIDQLKIQSTN